MSNARHYDESLIDLARAEDFTDDKFLECFSETKRERELIDRIKGPGAHILEGPRGVGKSTLFKKAELELDAAFVQNKELGVYVNFKAALLMETSTDEFGYNPFLCWVVAKLLDAFYKKSRALSAIPSSQIKDRYERLFDISTRGGENSIEDTIRDLQALSNAATEEVRKEIISRLKERGVENYTNVDFVSDFMREIAADNNISRVVFLFDEAAHTFNERQQETFFEFFKLLHGDIVSVKAAVYPGITSYGGNFEIGQDAILISTSSIEENRAPARGQLIKHFRELLQKRLPPAKFRKFVDRGAALDTLILLSNGNPRMFLHTASKMLASKEISKRSALAASNDYVSKELVNYHLGLKKRLPRFASHIDLGMELVKGHLVPELQKKNEGKGANPKIQTVYFTIEELVPHKIKKALSLLEYSGYVFDKSVVKISKRRQSRRYSLNLAVAANDKIFHSIYSRNPAKAIKKLSIADYREFYASDDRFQQLVDENPAQESCPNGHLRNADGDFCPICGARFTINEVLKDLLNDPIQVLPMSDFLNERVYTVFSAETVGDVLKLTESQLQQAHMIGPVRSRMIINIAEEYISG
ncbi:hypothetical protein [Pseudodesulfovibrio sp.]|uniref:ORC-CDC6 family AAA ATPase n=1 Tax=unclassified Pseudodesulfovibrio TaxID=2661612 RepID=UPI003AFF8118